MIGPAPPPVAIIGYRVWTERYGSDPSIVGRTVRLNGEAATIIGVMPEGFAYPVDTQIWRPLSSFPGIQQAAASVRSGSSAVWPAASPATQAQAELAAILSTLTTVRRRSHAAHHRHAAQRNLLRQGHAAGADDADGGGAWSCC